VSRTPRIRPTGAALIVGAMIGALALAGCGAGLTASTSTQVAAIEGADSPDGPVVVRDAQISYPDDVENGAVHPAGSSAPLRGYIVNQVAEADRLVSVTAEVAESVEVTGEVDLPGGQTLVVEGEPEAAPEGEAGAEGAQPTEPAEPGTADPEAAEAGAEGTEPEAGAATPTPAPTGEAPLPAEDEAAGAPPVAPVPGGPRLAQIVLTNLREDVRPGISYEVVFVFERAGEIRLGIPMGPPPTTGRPAEAGE
jgi:hypothetical protein